MKIKIWNYITDFDAGIECVAYPTKEAAEAAAWQSLENIFREDGGADGFKPAEWEMFKAHHSGNPEVVTYALTEGTGCQLAVVETEIEVPPEKPARIGVVMEGGVVQNIYSDRPCSTQVYVIDYDTGDQPDDELTEVPQDGGGTAFANTNRYYLSGPDDHGNEAFDAIDAEIAELEARS